LRQFKVAGLQTIEKLQARALRRADENDELDRLLRIAKGRLRQQELGEARLGFWGKLMHLMRPNRLAAEVDKLARKKARAAAAMKVAVDSLHQAHCQQLRAAPWSRTLLAPTEAELRGANEDYHPWNRVKMSGKRALQALRKVKQPDELDVVDKAVLFTEVIADGPAAIGARRDSRKIAAMNRAADPVRSFVRALRLLARARPEARTPKGSRTLEGIADTLGGVRTRLGVDGGEDEAERAQRTISDLMAAVARASGAEFDDVESAQDRLEEVNHQIALAAWSKIPARLRPPGR
jgi:hypothetical protein